LDALTLLSGDARAFCEKVWASRVHLHHAAPESLAGLLSLDDVDHLLTATALRTPALRVVKDGSVLPSASFTRPASLAGSPLTGLVDARKVLAQFDAGATVVLQGLHRFWPPLTDLVRELELALGHPCQANAYLTPPGSQGFARHSDSHDVFVLQTHGRKLWEVWENIDGGSDDTLREVMLAPGLSMYLPAATPHSARSQDATSLHVTLGINQVSHREVLRQISEGILADERYDEPLPAGYLDDPEALTHRLAELLSAFAVELGSADAARVADERIDAFLTDRVPYLRGGLTDRVELDQLSDTTRLARRPTAACELKQGPEVLRVLLGDRELRMPLRLSEVMAFVRDNPSFEIGELGRWLDPESRLVVCRRLVREGLLRIVP
jgi:lysine-specific demethylase/histidyl-hydroxylase NO66